MQLQDIKSIMQLHIWQICQMRGADNKYTTRFKIVGLFEEFVFVKQASYLTGKNQKIPFDKFKENFRIWVDTDPKVS
jgi:hypothetical protein